MRTYSPETRKKIQTLRKEGYTYTEIQEKLKMNIPKGTLSYICKGIVLTDDQMERIYDILRAQLPEKQRKAVSANRKIHNDKIESYRVANLNLRSFMATREAKMVALAMLYLGEGAKWKGGAGLKLASSSPQIIKLYIDLLQSCYDLPIETMRARVQHRADQNSEDLVQYWSDITNIPYEHFYLSYMDKRTIGKKTLKTDYKGVCMISCAGSHIQLELEQIAGIISSALGGISAAG